jgi:hypothetical protein
MKNKAIILLSLILASSFLFLSTSLAAPPDDIDFGMPQPKAQTPIACESWEGGFLQGVCKDPSKIEFCHLFVLMDNVINWIMFVAMPLMAFLLLAWGGFNYIIYLENPANTKKFWDTAKSLLWGAIVIYTAYAVVNLFLIIVGAKIFNAQAGVGQWFKFPCGVPVFTVPPPPPGGGSQF